LTPDEWDAAAGVLRAAWGPDVTLASATSLYERDHVVRLVADDGRRAVLKRARSGGQGLWGDVDGFQVEWAALEALGAMPVPVAPTLLGGDPGRGLFVMEDLDGPTLAASLLSAPAPAGPARAGAEPTGTGTGRAEADLVAFAGALAGLHAAGILEPGRFAAARDRHGLPPMRSRWGAMVAAGRARFTGALAEVFGPGGTPAGLDAELDRVERLLDGHGDAGTGTDGAGDGMAGIVHGDPCPDNVLLVDGRARILDYERASPGSVAMDAAYLLAPFPSCWCFAPLPPTVAAAAYDAYLAVRSAAGAPVGPAWAEEMAAALVAPFAMHAAAFARALGSPAAPGDSGPGLDGMPWGTTTTAPRLATWAATFLADPAAAALPQLTAVVAAARDRLVQDGVADAAGALAYPAFPTAGTTPVTFPEEWLEG
jgi:Ser/Thr protein kinase RdoA (MazF antagonist)